MNRSAKTKTVLIAAVSALAFSAALAPATIDGGAVYKGDAAYAKEGNLLDWLKAKSSSNGQWGDDSSDDNGFDDSDFDDNDDGDDDGPDHDIGDDHGGDRDGSDDGPDHDAGDDHGGDHDSGDHDGGDHDGGDHD